MHTMRNRKKLYKNFNAHLISQFSILIICALFLSGCGKKAPPVPPRQVKLPAGNDLCLSINGDTRKLTWATTTKKGRSIGGGYNYVDL